MGGCLSSSPATVPTSALDATLALRLKSYVASHPDVHASKSLHTFALSFPKMLRAFEDIRVVFDRVDADKNGAIDESELKLLLAELDTADLDDATIADIFAQADANGDGSIDYREFVALAAVLYLMSDRDPGAPPESETEARRLVHVALDRVLEAWLYFDRDRRGFISRAEVKDGLRVYRGEARDQATGGKKKKAHVGVDSNLLAARFEEINWGRHDVVTFQEFLYAVEGWVGLEEEEE